MTFNQHAKLLRFLAALLIALAVIDLILLARAEELPITVTIINCVDYPDDERCEQFADKLNDLEPAAGVAEWTPEEPVMEHME